MNYRHYNILLLLSSLIGYLQWGNDQASFLFEIEYDIFSKLFTDPLSVVHPFVLIPMVGQLFLIWSIMAKKPNKYTTYTGITCIAILFLMILFVGIITARFWIILSALPYLTISVLTIRYYRKLPKTNPKS